MTSVYAHLWNMKVEMEISDSSGGDVCLGIDQAPEELGKHHIDVNINMTQDQLDQLADTIRRYRAERPRVATEVKTPSNEGTTPEVQ